MSNNQVETNVRNLVFGEGRFRINIGSVNRIIDGKDQPVAVVAFTKTEDFKKDRTFIEKVQNSHVRLDFTNNDSIDIVLDGFLECKRSMEHITSERKNGLGAWFSNDFLDFPTIESIAINSPSGRELCRFKFNSRGDFVNVDIISDFQRVYEVYGVVLTARSQFLAKFQNFSTKILESDDFMQQFWANRRVLEQFDLILKRLSDEITKDNK